MSLMLYWEFESDGDPARAAQVVAALRNAAENAGFEDVGPVVEAWADRRGGDAGAGEDAAQGGEAAVDRAWVMSQGLISVQPEGATEAVRVAPAHVMAFRALSPGAEDAVFGLAAYPARGEVAGGGVAGYRWASGCSTQGAAKRGGMPKFLKAHRAVVAVLDKARGLGVKVTARDDGQYWERRDPKVLIDKLEEWETIRAAVADRRRATPGPVLACDVREKLEAARRAQKRLDRAPVEELEG